MKPVELKQPQRIVFGTGCLADMVSEILAARRRHLFLITATPILPLLEKHIAALREGGTAVTVETGIKGEPTVADTRRILALAREAGADAVVGIGGGSVMDVAKLVATFLNATQDLAECYGKGFIERRGLWFALAPTTAGTGSEVSPNAILLDESDNVKKGIISNHLLADVAYLDPVLTYSVPPRITAETGLDALTHCIEVYTNVHAHPCVDIYALKGISLIAQSLLQAVEHGDDAEAREAMLLGAMYGGLGLGPVNTAAVHALAYPVGGLFHKSHGLSNALLLPTVMRFNITEETAARYADVAVALGCPRQTDDLATALAGADRVAELSKACGIPQTLSEVGIPQSAVPEMAAQAMLQQRLLVNNPRPVTEKDAADIYNSLY